MLHHGGGESLRRSISKLGVVIRSEAIGSDIGLKSLDAEATSQLRKEGGMKQVSGYQ